MPEFHGFQYRVKWQNRQRKERSLEVCVSIHPLQIPHQIITSLHHLWIKVGHTEPGIDGHRFRVDSHWFESKTPYVGERRTLKEAFEMMIGVIKPVVDQLQSPRRQ